MKRLARSRTLAVARILITMTALVIGCRGAVDRTYFDDDSVVSGSDASLDDRTNTVDSSSNDGATDAPTDVTSDAPDADAGEAGAPHSIGGVVLGLSGTGMVLRLNGANDLQVSPSGGGNVGFTFSKTVAEGEDFAVTIKTQPAGQQCSVSGGTGKVGTGDIS